MSDHEAVYCKLTLNNRPESDDTEHPIFLYDRSNMIQLKTDLSAFQIEFLSSDQCIFQYRRSKLEKFSKL